MPPEQADLLASLIEEGTSPRALEKRCIRSRVVSSARRSRRSDAAWSKRRSTKLPPRCAPSFPERGREWHRSIPSSARSSSRRPVRCAWRGAALPWEERGAILELLGSAERAFFLIDRIDAERRSVPRSLLPPKTASPSSAAPDWRRCPADAASARPLRAEPIKLGSVKCLCGLPVGSHQRRRHGDCPDDAGQGAGCPRLNWGQWRRLHLCLSDPLEMVAGLPHVDGARQRVRESPTAGSKIPGDLRARVRASGIACRDAARQGSARRFRRIRHAAAFGRAHGSGLGQFPIIIGGIVVATNIEGVGPGVLRLSGPLLADIFLGRITSWSDPAIAASIPVSSCLRRPSP